MATGLSLTLDRTETVNSVTKFDDEQVTIGIWLRWYFVNVKSVALYADINPYFVSVNQNLSSIDTNTINIESNGQGFGVSPGIGFVYFLNENVGFSLQVDYFLSAINATRTDRINNIIQEDNIRSDQLRFSFGFQLYLDEFFF